MTLRILHVLDHSIPLQSGYAFRTRAILREQRRRGWQTFHVTGAKHAPYAAADEEVDGLLFHRTFWRAASALARVPVARELAMMNALARRVGDVAGAVRPDVLHAHSPVLDAFPALRVGRALDVPVVYEVRAFWEDAAVDHGTATEGGIRYRLTRALETRAMRRAHHVVTICNGLRDDIVARGIPASKVTVVPNAVDIASFAQGAPADAELKRRLGFEPNDVVIGFIGSFYAYEGLDLLLDALPRVVAIVPAVRLLLVGGGPHDAQLRSHAERLGLGGRVAFAGRVSHADVGRYYDLIDVLAYPRRRMRLTELVTPLKPLEAMAQGRVLVASDVGGHRELIRDGETGVLFGADDAAALADAILRVLASRDRWPALRAAGRLYVERERNWARSVGRYDDVYGALVERAERGGAGAVARR